MGIKVIMKYACLMTPVAAALYFQIFFSAPGCYTTLSDREFESPVVGLALKNQSSSDNPVFLAIERYWMTSCKSCL